MNKIFKVIWSKTRNCYVVASELAKGTSKSTSTGRMAKRAALAAVAALLISPLGAGYVSAADSVTVKDTSNTDQIVYTKDGVDAQLSGYAKNTTVNQNADDISELKAKTEAIIYGEDSNTVIVTGKLTATEGITDGTTTQNGKYVNADNYVGQNLNALDTQVKANANAIAEKANAADVYTKDETDQKVDAAKTYTYRKVATEEKARKAADTALNDKITSETLALVAADTKLAEAVNGGLSLSDDNVLQKNTTTIDTQGNVTTSKTDANEMILNKGKDNQITLNKQGIKVGTNSSVMDKDGVYTGGDDYTAAKAALKSDGSIKGADGKFTVDGTNGNVNTNGSLTATSGKIGNVSMSADGTMTGVKDLTVSGKITGTGLDVGAGTIKTTGATETGTLKTTGKAEIGGNLDVKGDLSVEGEFNAKTLSSKLNENNYTEIHGGNVTSVNTKVDITDGKTYTSTSTLTEKGKTETASNGINRNVNKMDATESSNVITNDANGQTSTFNQRVNEILNQINSSDTVFSKVDQKVNNITSEVTDGTNTTSSTQTTTNITNTAKQGTITNEAQKLVNKASDTISNEAANDITNTSTNGNISNTANNGTISNTAKNIENTASENITNTAKNGSITNDAKNIANIASETLSNSAKNITNTTTNNMTNTIGKNLTTTVGGEMKTTVTGKVAEDYKSDLDTKVGGSQTTTVTGDSSLTAENITNEAKNKITNKALDVETDASSSIVSKVSNEYGSNTSTQLSYQTTEEMSQADGKKASYLRGAAEEKSQLTDGDKKTTIDTVAGQTNTNITDGTNTSNSLQKADQVASSVTDGTNTTVVNQDATSLASSITDGTKANNTNNTVDKSEQLIKADDTHSYAETKTAGSAVEALKSDGNMIIIGKDAATATVSSAVTDGTNTTGSTMTAKGITNSAAESIVNEIGDGSKVKSEMTAKGITNTAKDGTITNDAKDVLNKGTNSVINEVGNNQVAVTTGSVKVAYGSDTSTIWDANGITSATSGDMKNNAKNIANTATKSITDKVGENTSWEMTDGTVVESVKDASGKTNQTTTTAADTYQSVQNGKNVLAKKTSSTNDNLNITDGTNTYTKITTATSNKQTVTDGTETASTNLTKSASNTYITKGAQTVTNHIAADITNTVMNEGSNGSRQEQTASQILNRVTDGTDTSEVKQTASEVATSAKDITNTASEKITNQIGNGSAVKSEMTADGITNTAEGGTIYNKSKDILNEASGDILNFADGEIGNVATKITNITGNNTVTSDTNGTTFENTANSTAIKKGTVTKTTISGNTLETGQATMDYADVMKDLGVHGSTTLGTTANDKLTVNATSTFNENVSMKKDLSVGGTTTTDKLVVNNGATIADGATVTGGTTTDTLKVTGSSEFGGKATFNDIVNMNKGLSVTGGVTADTVTADSYKVGDKTYIDSNGINANNQKVVNVAPGRIAADSTDAVNGSQLYQTNERVTGVENKVNKLDSRVDKVGANAAALANLHPLEFDADSKWNIAAAVGGYKGETATAIGAFYRPNENVMVNVSSSFGTGENMYGGGISLRIGQGGNKARRNATNGLTDREKAMQKQIDSLTNRLDALLSVINPNMSKDFPDVPENHWAYEAVSRLAGNGIIQGYEDGKYHGERTMTRYEMAEIIYNALSKGAKAEKKLVEEFKPELQAMAAQKKA